MYVFPIDRFIFQHSEKGCSIMLLSPYSRQSKERIVLSTMEGDFFMGKIRKTYSKEIKVKAIDLYFEKDMGIR